MIQTILFLLASTTDESGADNTEYRTEIESYVRFFSRGRIGNSPDHFEAKMKDGSIFEYGSSSNSRVNISSRFHWTDIPINIPIIGLFPYLFY